MTDVKRMTAKEDFLTMELKAGNAKLSCTKIAGQGNFLKNATAFLGSFTNKGFRLKLLKSTDK